MLSAKTSFFTSSGWRRERAVVFRPNTLLFGVFLPLLLVGRAFPQLFYLVLDEGGTCTTRKCESHRFLSYDRDTARPEEGE